MARYDLNITPTYVPSAPRNLEAEFNRQLAGLMPPREQAKAPTGRVIQGIGYSDSKNAYLINGQEISARDEASLLEASKTADLGAQYEAPTGDWAQVDPASFGEIVGKIANPDFMTRMGKSFESAAASSGELLGAAARFAGLEEPGKALMESSQRRQQELSPYSVQFTDIGKDPTVDVVDWIASTVGQLGPSVIETAVSTLIGAGVGFVSGAGVGSAATTPVGAIAGLVGKEAFKKALVEATELYAKQALKIAGKEGLEGGARQAAIKSVPKAKIVEALKATDDGMQALKVMRNAGAIAGGAIANFGNSYLTGIGDITADQLASGRDPGELDRLNTLWQSAVYAGIETAPDVLIARSLFGSVKRGARDLAATKKSVDFARDLLSRAGTVAAGAGRQGLVEGGSEFSQELLLMMANPLTDWSSPEVSGRLTNSFAAGALMGGLVGGPANLLDRSRTEADEAKTRTSTAPATTPAPAPAPAPATTPAQGELFPNAPIQQAPTGMQGPGFAEPVAAPASQRPVLERQLDQIRRAIRDAGPVGAKLDGVPLERQAELVRRAIADNIARGATEPQLNAMRQALTALETQLQRMGIAGDRTQAAQPNDLLLNASLFPEMSDTTPQMDMFLRRGIQQAPAQMPLGPPDAINQPVELDIELATNDSDTKAAPAPAGPATASDFFVSSSGEAQIAGRAPAYMPLTGSRPALQAPPPLLALPAPAWEALLRRGMVRQRPPGALPPKTFIAYPSATREERAAGFTGEAPTSNDSGLAAKLKAAFAKQNAAEQKDEVERQKAEAEKAKADQDKTTRDRNDDEVVTSVYIDQPVKLAIDAAAIPSDTKATKDRKRKVLSWFNGLSKEQQDTVLNDERYDNKIGEFIDDVASAVTKIKYEELVRGLQDSLKTLVPSAPPIEEPKTKALKRNGTSDEFHDILSPYYFKIRMLTTAQQEALYAKLEEADPLQSLTILKNLFGIAPAAPTPPTMEEAPKTANTFQEKPAEEVKSGPKPTGAKGTKSSTKPTAETPTTESAKPAGKPATSGGNQPTITVPPSMGDQVEAKVRDKAATTSENLLNAAKSSDKPGRNFRIDGTPIANPMEVGKVKLLLNTIKSKLRIAPKTHVFRSLQELKSSNPALYRAAKAARTEGDFDTVKAAGYSFGDTVILFSDNIQTEQQLRFIMAHETIGHFGLRSIADAASVNKLLNSLYDNDFRVRTATDAYMTRMGIPKLEAIEEVLADNAAHLDTSLLARITTFIKNALNKIGVTFGDEFAREVVSQLRKYVRYGELNGTPVSATQIAENMIRLEEQAKIGRFSQNNTFTSVAQGFNWLASLANGVFTGRQDLRAEAQRFLSDNKTNVGELFKDVLNAFSTPQGLSVQNYGTKRINSIFTDMDRLRNTVTSRLVEVAPDLYKIATGKPDLRQAEELFIHRMLELYKNFKPGAEQKDPDLVYTDKFEADGTPIRNDEAIAAYKKRILATPEMFQEGINFRDESAPFKDDKATEDSPAYKLYSQMVDVLTEQQILRLQSVIRGGKVNANLAFAYLRSAKADDAQIAIVEEARRLYTNLAMEKATIDEDSGMIKLNDKAKTKADKFAIQVTRVMSKEFGDKKLKDWLEGNPKEDSEQFRTPEFDDFIGKLSKLNKLKLDNDGLIEVNTLIVNSVFNSTVVRDAQLYAKQSILRHYTPLDRSGEYAVKVAVVDENGNTVSLSKESMSQIPYYEFDTKADADKVMAELNEAFATQFKDPDLTDVNGDKIDNKYRLVAFSGAISKTAEMRVTVNPNMLIKAIENLGIKLPADAIKKLVTQTTKQNDAARRNLERNVNAGFRRDIRNVQAEFSEFIASIVANNVHRPEVDDLFKRHNQWMWMGDRSRLDKLKADIKAATTADERREAEQKYAEYATQFRYSSSTTTSEGLDNVEINGKKYKLMGRGGKYRDMAARMVDTLNRSNGELVEVSEAIFGKGFGAKLRSFSVLAQLGGSVASGLLNIIGLSTNTWSYLAYMNKQNGFGGGYGAANSALAINKALADTFFWKLNDIAYLKSLTPGNKHNLTAVEINFLIKVAEHGELAASQSQALMGATRGRNLTVQNLMDKWMGFFNYTEQLTRRTTALATFRLEYQRQLAIFGANPTAEQKSAASSRATKFAEAAVGYTQGRYGMMDRPELGRTGLLQYPFQYKQFVINSIELLANMDTSGRVQYLTTMLILAGVSGLPFAEDIGDLLDTLLSFFGIPRANVEKEMLMFYDSILPGSAEWINKGILDQLIGVSVSSRIGLGNILPFTATGVPGADTTREIMDFAGPVVGLLAGTTSFVDGILSMPLEAAGIKAGETSLRDVFRNSPVTALRSVGDAWAYLDTGAIVSADGRMVADNVSGFTIFMRLLGFYPAEASRQNNMVRLGKQNDAYRNDIAAKFRLDYIRAGMSNGMKGNREAMARVIDEVERWNKSAKGTGLEINNFVKNARNALKDAQMSTAERFLKATSKANRPVMEELADVMGIE